MSNAASRDAPPGSCVTNCGSGTLRYTAGMKKTEEEWRHDLSTEQYRVLREHGTEPRGSSPLNKEKREGVFKCAGCGKPLFESATKYDSGTGWPSFYRPLDQALGETVDKSYGMTRTEVHCAE